VQQQQAAVQHYSEIARKTGTYATVANQQRLCTVLFRARIALLFALQMFHLIQNRK
jgi:hypothetical protein